MDWKKIAPWNWFKDEEPTPPPTPARVDPGSDSFAALRAEMERFFDDGQRRLFPERLPMPLRPKMDISEGRKAYTVRAELPGVEREDVSIEIDDRTVLIRGEKRQESEEDDEGYHCIERSYGAIQRVLSLPDDADANALEAKFRNGVLKLRIPKQIAPASKSRQIEIQAG